MLGRAFILVVLGLILNARGEDSCRPATICCEESPRRCGGVCECIRFSQLMTRERVLRVQFAPGTHLVYADRVLVEAVGDPVPRIIHTSDVSSDAPTMQTQSKSSIQATVDTTPTMPTRSKSSATQIPRTTTIASLPNPGKTTQTTDFSTAGKTLRVLMPMNMTPIVIISTVSVVGENSTTVSENSQGYIYFSFLSLLIIPVFALAFLYLYNRARTKEIKDFQILVEN
uniref:Uncharacterized protein LOC111117861 isoform X7 n=1 Tax=Crassostrea virginica TaxID=6565 RepID=A0A8B8CAL7_CRAVI|nr:uncharacterized protein LOC111117861 isoform X7 [Crassostrea virginica]XP_022312803.1 uncharacterized protein LOC111117861 isoform X8 [Crassostrea virginica]